MVVALEYNALRGECGIVMTIGSFRLLTATELWEPSSATEEKERETYGLVDVIEADKLRIDDDDDGDGDDDEDEETELDDDEDDEDEEVEGIEDL